MSKRYQEKHHGQAMKIAFIFLFLFALSTLVEAVIIMTTVTIMTLPSA